MKQLSKRGQGVARPAEPIGPAEPNVSAPWTSYTDTNSNYTDAPQPGGGEASPFDALREQYLPNRLSDEDIIFNTLEQVAANSSKEQLLKAIDVYKKAYPYKEDRMWRNLIRRLLPLTKEDLIKDASSTTCRMCGLPFSEEELLSGGEYIPRGGLCPICRLSYGG